MKRMERKRAAIAALLLSIVLPIVLIAPFHHHGTEKAIASDCDYCTHQQPHSGHLASSGQLDKCLVCQFLSIPYLPEKSTSVAFVPEAKASVSSQPAEAGFAAPVRLLPSRAPPVSVC
ncbi:MAG: hypothetical protein II874_04895 [Bacteroidales bacterium]|nr:hypothetical protein [Bacteroidales bacterium]MBR6882382.1 hypothetical protein [Bacteroidales bacterium]